MQAGSVICKFIISSEIHKTYAKRFVQTHAHMQFFRNARGKLRGTDDSGGIHSRIKGLFAYLREHEHHVVHAASSSNLLKSPLACTRPFNCTQIAFSRRDARTTCYGNNKQKSTQNIMQYAYIIHNTIKACAQSGPEMLRHKCFAFRFWRRACWWFNVNLMPPHFCVVTCMDLWLKDFLY